MATTEAIPFTRKGYEALKRELEILKTIERPKVIQEIAEARAHGDLKENAEYHAAREKQSFIEGRITILDDSISRANIISFAEENPDTVKFGSYVTVEDEQSGEEKTYQIVGDLEADISKNMISMGSPIAKALMGKRIDDSVEVKVPKGIKEYVVTNIRYD
ncbi:MAG: transcription elongation factor GreA [Oligoflexus sp.]